jgi:beta-lactamase class A
MSRGVAVLLLAAVLLTVAWVSGRPWTAAHRALEAAPRLAVAGGSPMVTAAPAGVAAAPAGAAATAPAGVAAAPAGVAATAPLPARPSAAQQAGCLNRLFGGGGDSYSVAALDLSTGRSVRLGAGGGMVAASLVKLDFLQALLHQHQLSGRPLSPSQHHDARAMMRRSDNAAADRIWAAVGGNTGLRRYNSLLGLRDTVFDADGRWGLSTTSADDQMLLLQALTSTSSPLEAASRRYALELMGQVQSDQRWGVSAAGDPGSDPAIKNGWLGVDADGGRWVANSAGVLQVGGRQVLMVVLSQHQPGYSTAVARVRQAALDVAAGL